MGAFAFRYFSRCCAQVAIMDIRAIVLVGGRSNADAVESVGGVPIGYLDALGLPAIERVLQRLRHFGICHVAVVREPNSQAAFLEEQVELDRHLRPIEAQGNAFWDAAEETFNTYSAEGAELILALRVGPYAEIDLEEMIQSHIDHHCTVSMAVDAKGQSLETFVLDPKGRFDARVLFQSHLQHLRKDCYPFRATGYVNRLANANDLRKLALDGLMSRNSVRPEGMEIKPGVFVGRGARIHRKARIVAPAFIGARCRVHASALITRGSVLEHHSEVDCGTVVESSTLLPFTRLGAGLDVMHSVVGFKRLTHLLRNVEVEITDVKLVDMVPVSAVSRLAGSAAAFFAFLPKQIYRGFFASSQRENAEESPECAEDGVSALVSPVLEAPASLEGSEFPSNLAVARRYGEH
jgi:hypothetical protein